MGRPAPLCARRIKIKLNPKHHYINKTKNLHYYLNTTFTNKEWDEYINGKIIHGLLIHRKDTHRNIPTQCERYSSGSKGQGPVTRCPNESFYITDITGIIICKECARKIASEAYSNETFTKLSDR